MDYTKIMLLFDVIEAAGKHGALYSDIRAEAQKELAAIVEEHKPGLKAAKVVPYDQPKAEPEVEVAPRRI